MRACMEKETSGGWGLSIKFVPSSMRPKKLNCFKPTYLVNAPPCIFVFCSLDPTDWYACRLTATTMLIATTGEPIVSMHCGRLGTQRANPRSNVVSGAHGARVRAQTRHSQR